MTIRAKFRCNSVSEHDYGSGIGNREFSFSAIYGREGENAQFSKATPTGTLKIMVDKDTAAYDLWKPGKEYYIDFNEVPKPGTV